MASIWDMINGGQQQQTLSPLTLGLLAFGAGVNDANRPGANFMDALNGGLSNAGKTLPAAIKQSKDSQVQQMIMSGVDPQTGQPLSQQQMQTGLSYLYPEKAAEMKMKQMWGDSYDRYKVVGGGLVDLANPNGPKMVIDPPKKTPGTTYVDPETGEVRVVPTTGNPALDKQLAAQDAKTLKGYTDASDTASNLADKADQFQGFRKQMWRGGPIAGHLPSFSSAAQNADSLNTDMATALTSLQKGAQSDKELGLALRSVPNGSMSQEAVNASVAKIKAASSVMQTKQSFMDQYVQAHGSLRGAEAKWVEFRKQNPIMNGENLRPGLEQVYRPDQDFSSFFQRQSSPNNQTQQSQQYSDGMTATNPQTGEKVVFRGGQWVKANGQ